MTNTRALSRDRDGGSEGVAAPGVPMVGDGGANAKPPNPPNPLLNDLPKIIMTMACGTCQGIVDAHDHFCKHCGAELIKRCSKCGADNQSGNFCSNCGGKLGKKTRSKRNTAD